MPSSMKPMLIFLFSFLFLSSVWAADLKTYQETYRKNSEQILQSFQPKFDGLQQHYQKSLEAFRTTAQNQGDLTKTKAAVTEIERFQTAKSLPAKLDDAEIPEIKTLQASYVKQFSAWEQDMTVQLNTLTTKYEQALDRLQKELVKTGKLDEATAVRQERDRVQTTITGYADQLAKQKESAATNGTRMPEREPSSTQTVNRAPAKRPILPTGCDKGILVYYTFDSVDDGMVADSGPKQRHGKAVQVVHVDEGKVGGALRFSGNGAHVVIPAPRDVELGKDDFTIATWIKTTTDGGLLGKGGAGSWEWHEKQFYIRDGKPAFVGHSCGIIKSNAAVADGNWHHLAVTYGWAPGRRAGRQDLYVDGKCVTSIQDFTGNPDPPTATDLRIGWGNSTDSGKRDFDGILDEFMIFKRCLSGPQVQKLYETLGGK